MTFNNAVKMRKQIMNQHLLPHASPFGHQWQDEGPVVGDELVSVHEGPHLDPTCASHRCKQSTAPRPYFHVQVVQAVMTTGLALPVNFQE